MPRTSLTRAQILDLFERLDAELAQSNTLGELHVVGGAVMCLGLNARDATADVDAIFKPAEVVRDAAARAAIHAGVPTDWLNDGVQGFLGPRHAFAPAPFFERPHLRVFFAEPHYLLALKCAAMRLGPEFHDEGDVRYLLRHLNIQTASEALRIVAQYVPIDRVPPKTRYALEEMLPS